MWFYLPVALRFIDGSDIHGVSGVQIVHFDNAFMESFVITFCHLANPFKYRIIMNSHNPSNLNNPKWYLLQIAKSHPIDLSDLSGFKDLGFRLFPRDSVKESQMSLLTLQCTGNIDTLMKDNKKLYKNLVPLNHTESGAQMSVVSYPFNFTNLILFSSFHSKGTICAQLPNFLLSDVKYLENMAGGVVLEDGMIVGLVLGNLKKLNGDGDLVVVIPWKNIAQTLHLQSIPQKITTDNENGVHSLHIQVNENTLLRKAQERAFQKRNQEKVFPVVVSADSGTTWGSCVIYNSTTLITNTHVLEPYLKSRSGEITIYCNGEPVNISKDQIRTPYPEIDLSFINLNQHIQVETTKSRNYLTGDEVYTKGYGLFIDKANPAPLVSRGHINTIFPLELSGDMVNSLIVTSSSCWNGSSGGGLFDENDNFIGLICSNAQVLAQKPFGDQGRLLEKLSKVVFVLPIELIDFCYTSAERLNPHVAQVWNLGLFHTDVVVLESKL